LTAARSGWSRAFAVLPDAVTAGWFTLVWWRPLLFGALSVQTAMLTMLLEFFLVHGTGFFTVLSNARDLSPWKRTGAMLALSLFYFLMLTAFALSYHAFWPILAFAWLLVGKIAWVWSSARAGKRTSTRDAGAAPGFGAGGEITFRQMAAWAGSVVLFLIGAVVTSGMDVPRWGMTADVQPAFGLDMASEGLWESQPHRVVAFGVFYFAVTFAVKALLALFDAWAARKQARGQ
jgi:hypothetical protein